MRVESALARSGQSGLEECRANVVLTGGRGLDRKNWGVFIAHAGFILFYSFPEDNTDTNEAPSLSHSTSAGVFPAASYASSYDFSAGDSLVKSGDGVRPDLLT